MTAVPPRRRQQPLNLEGAWLVTESPDGTKDVPGMSVVADARGFTVVGPEPGAERTIPWSLTTGFTCQRPARLPDGSPATMLEVGLANGRVLQLMLPVNRVPPSETVVVETELAVMYEQYGGTRPTGAAPDAPAPLTGNLKPLSAQHSAEVRPQSSDERPGVKRNAAHEHAGEAAGPRSQPSGSSANGSSANGPSANGSTANVLGTNGLAAAAAAAAASAASAANGISPLQAAGRSLAPEHSESDVAVAPAQRATSPAFAPKAAPAPAAAATALAPAPAPAAAPLAAPAGETASAPGAVVSPMGLVAPLEPAVSPDPQPQSPPLAQPEAAPEAIQSSVDTSDTSDTSEERREARETRLLYMLVALIGVVVVVLIAELVLILFVLNHNTTSHNTTSMRQTTTLVYSPLATLH
jgi:hypothetical protein